MESSNPKSPHTRLDAVESGAELRCDLLSHRLNGIAHGSMMTVMLTQLMMMMMVSMLSRSR